MSHDDFAFEPIKGLPQEPPRGEVILWQGRPHWWRLTVASLNLWWVVGYFVCLGLWRFVSVIDVFTLSRAIAVSVPFLILGGITALMLMIVGYVQARSTVYTITNRRVAMRVGAALTVTLNVPFTQIENASVARGKSGTGNIALDTVGHTPFSFLVLWPHARPWHFAKPQPTLRSIPNVTEVSDVLAKAAKARIIEVENSQDASAPELSIAAQ